MGKINIDISYDMRTDSKSKDPDKYSSTLRKYHQVLWSKKLPNGNDFYLDDMVENKYLYHKSELGEFDLTSDSIIHTYFKWKRLQHIIELIPENLIKSFYDLAHTVGGYTLFPGNRIDSLNTMNQERGMNKKINDRIDLTLECIRRYYLDEISPLKEAIDRYNDFFALFEDFKGYCEFFLMQDLVSEDYSEIKFFLPLNGFESNPLPKDMADYINYLNNNVDFIKRRNNRICEYNNQ